jgi:hypothetical protein
MNICAALDVHGATQGCTRALNLIREESLMELTTCPECGNAAEIKWRDVLESTDGPIEHVKIVCVERHWFLMPTASLNSPQMPERTYTSRTTGGGVRDIT